jgi:hypothetical protein
MALARFDVVKDRQGGRRVLGSAPSRFGPASPAARVRVVSVLLQLLSHGDAGLDILIGGVAMPPGKGQYLRSSGLDWILISKRRSVPPPERLQEAHSDTFSSRSAFMFGSTLNGPDPGGGGNAVPRPIAPPRARFLHPLAAVQRRWAGSWLLWSLPAVGGARREHVPPRQRFWTALREAPLDVPTTGGRPTVAIFRSPCGCRYLMPTGELLRSCEDHAPYGGTAFDARDLLTRIESELGWPPAEDEPPTTPPRPDPGASARPGRGPR